MSHAKQRYWRYFLMGVAIFELGCSRKSEPVVRVIDTMKRGDRVVVEPLSAEFFEGQVLEVLEAKIKLQRTDSGDIVQVGKGDVYRLGETKPRLSPNDLGICEMKPHRWQSCRVLRSTADGFYVATTEGSEQDLRASQVLAPTGLSELNIRRRFAEVARRRSFEAAVASASIPRRVPGWVPAPRRMVVAERNGRWYGAQITEVDDDRVVLRWDGQKDLTDLPKTAIMPQPPACGVPQRGDRALRRPSGHGAPWVPVVVVAVDGGEVTVENIDRVRIVVDIRELCPMGESNIKSVEVPAPRPS